MIDFQVWMIIFIRGILRIQLCLYCTRKLREKNFHMSLWSFAFKRLPFGLCNAPLTFQQCMLPILVDMVKESMKVFIDDFSTIGDSFETCWSHLWRFLQKMCENKLRPQLRQVSFHVHGWHSLTSQGVIEGMGGGKRKD